MCSIHHLKKALVILISILYLIPVVGFSLDLHWCGKKVKVVSVNAAHETKCPCGTEMPFDCCKDVHLNVKVSDSQKCSKHISNPKQIHFNLLPNFVILAIGEPASQVEVFDFSSYHAPPFKSKAPVYITNSIFRI